MNIQSYLNDLNSLKSKNLFTIKKIDWWLLKHSDFYNETSDFVYSQHLFKMDDGSIVRLPPFGEPTDQEKFLDLYKALDTICEFHRNEKYFEQELTQYQKIKDSQSDLKIWIAKNEDLGAEKYVCFLVDYLDYSENAEHLNVYVHSSEDLEIYIHRQDFKNTIEFLEIFNELYWVKELLPESLERIRIEMEKNKNQYQQWK
ncbi:hypothetical protein [Aestuariivivens sediminis]|uniref:hypothetical protein n=1 Tax=Aestuariivivens sediminis TaxID=2913557 RepID=UPI001F594FED|nr:hypothetical protein [Aestuariivivens sediminis]